MLITESQSQRGISLILTPSCYNNPLDGEFFRANNNSPQFHWTWILVNRISVKFDFTNWRWFGAVRILKHHIVLICTVTIWKVNRVIGNCFLLKFKITGIQFIEIHWNSQISVCPNSPCPQYPPLLSLATKIFCCTCLYNISQLNIISVIEPNPRPLLPLQLQIIVAIRWLLYCVLGLCVMGSCPLKSQIIYISCEHILGFLWPKRYHSEGYCIIFI